MLRLSTLVFSLALTSCATLGRNPSALYMNEVDVPLSELRTTIVALLPMGLAGGSSNGRELTSKYFVPGPANTYKPGGDATQRYVAKIILLGDHRPYDVEVLVVGERRQLTGSVFRYVAYGADQRLTKQLVDRIQRELAKRRDDRNVIDDFRVY